MRIPKINYVGPFFACSSHPENIAIASPIIAISPTALHMLDANGEITYAAWILASQHSNIVRIDDKEKASRMNASLGICRECLSIGRDLLRMEIFCLVQEHYKTENNLLTVATYGPEQIIHSIPISYYGCPDNYLKLSILCVECVYPNRSALSYLLATPYKLNRVTYRL